LLLNQYQSIRFIEDKWLTGEKQEEVRINSQIGQHARDNNCFTVDNASSLEDGMRAGNKNKRRNLR
jgi:hypothetical protein